MNIKIKLLASCVLAGSLLSGCATEGYAYRSDYGRTGYDHYDRAPVYADHAQVQYGVIESINYGTQSRNHTGAVVGAVVGGLLGSTVGKGDGRTAATVGGAVVGGVIGNRVDKNRADDYTLGIRLENGEWLNLRQSKYLDVSVGQRVEVVGSGSDRYIRVL